MAISNNKLILEFFKNYKPLKKNNILIIPKAPKEFEEIFGKKAPYKLVFSLNKHSTTQGSELITQGSYFLSAMKEYMDKKGQTSLIKLNIKTPTNIVDKLRLGNCIISKIQKKITYNSLPEFTFFSNAQALNKRKQLLKKYLVKDKEILDLDLTKFKFLKPILEEFQLLEIDSQYDIAKKKFKENSIEEIKDIKIKLKEKLKTEFERINEFYENQIKEKDDEIDTCKKRINTLKSELKHTFYERDADTLKRNIRESEARCEMLKKQTYKERLIEEEKFHLRDEIDKHTLTIENKLVNTTIFYYPVTNFTLFLDNASSSNNKIKNKKSTKTNPKNNLKIIEISYDSLFEKFDFEHLVCESCKKSNIKEINLCKKGKHLVCKNCLKNCKACKKK